jgi:hypothetical protein
MDGVSCFNNGNGEPDNISGWDQTGFKNMAGGGF